MLRVDRSDIFELLLTAQSTSPFTQVILHMYMFNLIVKQVYSHFVCGKSFFLLIFEFGVQNISLISHVSNDA